MSIPQGRYHVGRFGGVKQVTKQTGEIVPGLFECRVIIDPKSDDDDPIVLRSSFFTTKGGAGSNEPSRIAEQFEALGLAEGEEVMVRVLQQTRNGYTNDKAVSVCRVADLVAESAPKPVRRAS